jgi:hypothetical protein
MLFGIVLSTIWGLLVLTGAVAVGIIAISVIITWAHNIFLSVLDGVIGFLYALRHALGATTYAYTQTYQGNWVSATREISNDELPPELRDLPPNQRQRVADFRR